MSASTNTRTRRLVGLIQLGGWVGTFARDLPPSYHSREGVYSELLRHIKGRTPLYFEFGVYQGASLRWWSARLEQPQANLVGFDSFEGLPEDWNAHMLRGAFAVPLPSVFDDRRVVLQVGWFEDTVPRFVLPDHDVLIVNIDCDLYSSTALVLEHLGVNLVPGSFIYFDELHDRDHELRAVTEFLNATKLRLEPIAMSEDGTHWAFRIAERPG